MHAGDPSKQLQAPPGEKQYIEYTNDMKNQTDLWMQVTEVKDVVFETLLPVLEQTSQMFRTVQNNDKSIRDYQFQMREFQQMIKRQNDKLEQIATFQAKIVELSNKCQKVEDKIKDALKTNQNELLVFKTKLQDQDKMFDSVKHDQMVRDERFKQMDEKIDQNFQQYCINFFVDKDREYKQIIEEFTQKLGSFEAELVTKETKYKSFSLKIQSTIDSLIDDVFKKHQKEMAMMDQQELVMSTFTGVSKKLNDLEPQVAVLRQEVQNLVQVPIFLEKSIPLIELFSISDCLKEVFGQPDIESGDEDKIFLQKLIRYEQRRVKEIIEYNESTNGKEISIGKLNQRLQALGKGYSVNNQGVLPFKMGRDYKLEMEPHEMNIINSKELRSQRETRQVGKNQLEGLKYALETIDKMADPSISKNSIENTLKGQTFNQMRRFIDLCRHKQLKNKCLDQLLERYIINKDLKDSLEPIQTQLEQLASLKKQSTNINNGSRSGIGSKFGMGSSKSKQRGINALKNIVKQSAMVNAMQKKDDEDSTLPVPTQKINKFTEATPADALRESSPEIELIQNPSESRLIVDQQLKVQEDIPLKGESDYQTSIKMQKPLVTTVGSVFNQNETSIDIREEDDANYTTSVIINESNGGGAQKIFVINRNIPSQKVKIAISKHRYRCQRQRNYLKRLIKKIQQFEQVVPKDIISVEKQMENDELKFADVARRMTVVQNQNLMEEIRQKEQEAEKLKNLKKRPTLNKTFTKGVNSGSMKNESKDSTIEEEEKQIGSNEKLKFLKSPTQTTKSPIHSDNQQKSLGAKVIGQKMIQEIGSKLLSKVLLEKQMRLKQFEEARPLYTIATMGLNKQQVQDVQKIVDSCIDWLHMFIKLDTNHQIDQMKQSMATFQEEFMGKVEVMEKQSDRQDKLFEQSNKMVQSITESYKVDNDKLNKFKQRLISDIQGDIGKMSSISADAQQYMQTNQRNIKRNNKILSNLLESCMINSLIQGQEIKDKQNLGLFGNKKNQEILGTNQGAMNNLGLPGKFKNGQISNKEIDSEVKKFEKVGGQSNKKQETQYNPLMIDKNSIEQQSMLNQLKQSCLTYVASPIKYRDINIHQSELMDIQDGLLFKCQQLMLNSRQVEEFIPRSPDKKLIFSRDSPVKIRSPQKDVVTMTLGSQDNESDRKSSQDEGSLEVNASALKAIVTSTSPTKIDRMQSKTRALGSKLTKSKFTGIEIFQNSQISGQNIDEEDSLEAFELNPSTGDLKESFLIQSLVSRNINEHFNQKSQQKSSKQNQVYCSIDALTKSQHDTKTAKSYKMRKSRLKDLWLSRGQKIQKQLDCMSQSSIGKDRFKVQITQKTKDDGRRTSHQTNRKRYGTLEYDGPMGPSQINKFDELIQVKPLVSNVMHIRTSSQPQVQNVMELDKSNRTTVWTSIQVPGTMPYSKNQKDEREVLASAQYFMRHSKLSTTETPNQGYINERLAKSSLCDYREETFDLPQNRAKKVSRPQTQQQTVRQMAGQLNSRQSALNSSNVQYRNHNQNLENLVPQNHPANGPTILGGLPSVNTTTQRSQREKNTTEQDLTNRENRPKGIKGISINTRTKESKVQSPMNSGAIIGEFNKEESPTSSFVSPGLGKKNKGSFKDYREYGNKLRRVKKGSQPISGTKSGEISNRSKTYENEDLKNLNLQETIQTRKLVGQPSRQSRSPTLRVREPQINQIRDPAKLSEENEDEQPRGIYTVLYQ